MDATTYIANRLDEQQQWLSQKSKSNQQKYKALKITEIICAASLPFLVGFNEKIPVFNYITGILGVLIVIFNGIQQLYKFRDNWINYRASAEALKREKFLFEAGTAPYNVPEAFPLLVTRVETILSAENTIWKINLEEKHAGTK
jgi:hypothetical protein